MKLSEAIPLIDYFVIGSKNINIIKEKLIPRIKQIQSHSGLVVYGNKKTVYYMQLDRALIKHAFNILTNIPELTIAVSCTLNSKIAKRILHTTYHVIWVPLDTNNHQVVTRTLTL